MSIRDASIHRPSTTDAASLGAASPRATVRCLGVAAVVVPDGDGGESARVNLGKALALLAYLALSPNRRASREWLADLLWGEQDRTAARQSLRRALHFLKSRVGPWLIEADDVACVASNCVVTDVAEFRDRAERGDHGGALELYHGDFLADFASPGCREFEAWADIERVHLRSLALRSAETWCRQSLDRAQFGDARRAVARMKQIDPTSELAWRLSLETAIASGDTLAATAEVARFTAWLAADGRAPDAASREVIRLATHASRTREGAPEVSTLPNAIELVGREKEFAGVLDAWRHVRAGSTQFVVVSGGAGLGKTRLLDAVADRIRSRRDRVAIVRAHVGERGLPLSFAGALAFELAQLGGAAGVPPGVIPALAALDPRLAGQFSVAVRDAAPQPPAASATAIRELIVAVADEASFALFLDDLHWCDESSLQILAGALARLSGVPALVVIATRQLASGLHIEGTATHLRLAAWSADDVEALIAGIGALPAGEEWTRFLLARITGASRGIPLFVMSALEQLVLDGTLVLRDGAWATCDRKVFRERLRNIDALATRLRALSPAASRLLLECGLAGVPLPRRAAESLASDHSALTELESAGHVRVGDAVVEPAHDVIGETAIALATDAEKCAATETLGRALLACDPPWDEHGVRHLASAGVADAIVPALTKIVHRRPIGTRADPRAIVATVLARAIDDPIVVRAARTLPFAMRHGRAIRRAGLAAAGVVILIAAFVAHLMLESARDVASFDIVEASGANARRVRLSLNQWAKGEPLDARSVRIGGDSVPHIIFGSRFMPSGNEWTIEVSSPDSGGVDVALMSRDGRRRRLTSARADEVPGAAAPDGRLIAINSAMRSASAVKQLAVLDVATRAVRVLGDSAAAEASAWSPDGTRIAYGARAEGQRWSSMCITTVDGARRSCVPAPAPNGDCQPLGWPDDQTVLVFFTAFRAIYEFDTRQGTFTAVQADTIDYADMSPDGHWLLFARQRPVGWEVFVAPVGDLKMVRRVATDAPIGPSASFAWRGAFAPREYLDTLSIEVTRDSVPQNAPTQLRLVGTSNRGRQMPVRVTTWSSLNPDVATVDSLGVLRPTRSGIVTIEASAAGWRRTERKLVVVADSSRVLLDEQWENPFDGRWIRYGHPRPQIVRDSLLGFAFHNNGDGYFFSGAYYSEPFDARAGLAVDMTVRWPVTHPVGQLSRIMLMSAHGYRDRQARWNHVTGYPLELFPETGCNVSYPAGETPEAVRAVSPLGTLEASNRETVPRLMRGLPARVRLQLLPDGRCAVWVEGQRPWISRLRIAPIDSMALIIDGSSVGARMLIGPLTVRRGVPNGLSWLDARVGR